MAPDESTDVTDIAQIAVVIKGVNKDSQLVVELLVMVPVQSKTSTYEFFFWIGDSFERMSIALVGEDSVY